MNRLIRSLNTRSFRAGSMSIVLSAVVIAVAVAVNVIVNLLPGAFTKLDTSADQLYALTAQAKELIASYDTDIEILYLVEEGSEDTVVKELLSRAAALNSHITLTTLDPVLHPEQASDYSSYNQNSFVVRSDKREKAVDYSEIYQTLYYYGGEQIDANTYQTYMAYYQYGMSTEQPTSETRYAGQTVLASALDYVTTDEIPVVYMITGHGEISLDSKLSGYLSDDNVSVKDLQLATEASVPDDADAVIIAAPQSDMSENECSRLNDYIRGGGHVILYTYHEFDTPENLEAMVNSYGMKRVPGLVMDTDANRYDSNYYLLYPKIENHAYTAAISGKYLFAPMAHGIVKTEQTPENVTVDGLLSTSDQAFARVGFDGSEKTVEKTDADAAGPFFIGANATYTADGVSGTLTWYSTPYLAITQYDNNGAAADLFLTTVEDGCEIGTSVSIATKQITTERLTVKSSDRVLWGFILIALIPIGTVVLGLCIWNKRRRK